MREERRVEIVGARKRYTSKRMRIRRRRRRKKRRRRRREKRIIGDVRFEVAEKIVAGAETEEREKRFPKTTYSTRIDERICGCVRRADNARE